jgi:peptide/nickel transport system permease protein
MTTYLIRRVIQLIPSALVSATLIFVLIHFVPGDPARLQLGLTATPTQIERLNRLWHLDDPLWTQYFYYLGRLVQGNLGTSIYYRVPVADLLESRLPSTIFLALLSMTIAVAIAYSATLLSVTMPGSVADRAIRTLAQAGFAVPGFVIALIAQVILGVQLQLLPVAGYGSSLSDHLYHLVLPSAIVAISVAPLLFRTLRIGVFEVVHQDYVRTAHAKGVSRRIVLYKHVMRNALLPTITVAGLNLGALLGGAVVVESIFALPGVGSLLVDSVNQRDYPAVEGAALVLALIFQVVNLLTDVLYSVVDPTISRE